VYRGKEGERGYRVLVSGVCGSGDPGRHFHSVGLRAIWIDLGQVYAWKWPWALALSEVLAPPLLLHDPLALGAGLLDFEYDKGDSLPLPLPASPRSGLGGAPRLGAPGPQRPATFLRLEP